MRRCRSSRFSCAARASTAPAKLMRTAPIPARRARRDLQRVCAWIPTIRSTCRRCSRAGRRSCARTTSSSAAARHRFRGRLRGRSSSPADSRRRPTTTRTRWTASRARTRSIFVIGRSPTSGPTARVARCTGSSLRTARRWPTSPATGWASARSRPARRTWSARSSPTPPRGRLADEMSLRSSTTSLGRGCAGRFDRVSLCDGAILGPSFWSSLAEPLAGVAMRRGLPWPLSSGRPWWTAFVQPGFP
ncbi:MAG: hypothetical protein QOK16_2329 [Solirubrobacteraceae bacterium]|nr:hypothetical protein [Solirubrobacteraceae bacterium]